MICAMFNQSPISTHRHQAWETARQEEVAGWGWMQEGLGLHTYSLP